MKRGQGGRNKGQSGRIPTSKVCYLFLMKQTNSNNEQGSGTPVATINKTLNR